MTDYILRVNKDIPPKAKFVEVAQPWLIEENLDRVTVQEFKAMSAYRQERHLDVAKERASKLIDQAGALIKWRQDMMAHYQPGKDSKP